MVTETCGIMRHTTYSLPEARSRCKGFTLLELMVAIALFAMISTASYKLFMSVTKAQEVTNTVMDELDELQRAEIILESDLFQAVQRPIRDDQGRQQPALRLPGIGGTAIEFTRAGWQNPLQATRSTLQRVAYSLEGKELIRYYWPMLDRAPGTKRIRQTVLRGVKNVKFRVLEISGDWLKTWPPTKSSTPGVVFRTPLKRIPQAIEVTITHEKVGAMITIVPLATYMPNSDMSRPFTEEESFFNYQNSEHQQRFEGINGY